MPGPEKGSSSSSDHLLADDFTRDVKLEPRVDERAEIQNDRCRSGMDDRGRGRRTMVSVEVVGNVEDGCEA